MTRFLEPTRERFLLAVAATLPAKRFIELHFFAPIRQGGVESGVAVIAAHPERVEEPIVADVPPNESDDDVMLSAADAPLVTVETVVRGVQRRSGDEEGPERMSGDDARDYVLAATR